MAGPTIRAKKETDCLKEDLVKMNKETDFLKDKLTKYNEDLAKIDDGLAESPTVMVVDKRQKKTESN
jgi:uncharacterized coiled-coil DUF342 family protein